MAVKIIYSQSFILMKKNLLSVPVIMVLCAGLHTAKAQSSTAFAITGESKGNVNWSVIREIDLSTGALVRNIYLPATEKPAHIDASTGKEMNVDATAAVAKGSVTPCTCQSPSLAAATAYDARQKRLYFTTLFGSDLQYIDVTKKELKIYHVTSQNLKAFPSTAGEADNITRMVFGSDGNGYAITNNGNHFIRFSTGKTISVKDLGSLTDKATNEVSIHAQAESWGGDMVADDAGSLYVFTVAAHVFKINPNTLEAQFLGTIKNLPTAFSINAAAVDKNGNVTVASSIDANSYFSVNMKSLEATAVAAPDKIYNASDFANSNLLATEKSSVAKVAPVVTVKSGETVSIYPNPVKNKLVNVYFNGDLQGKHMVEVVDVNGKKIAAKTIELSSKNQSQTIQLPASMAGGLYIVHVLGSNNKNVFTANIVVE